MRKAYCVHVLRLRKKGSENKPSFYDLCNMEMPKLAGSVIKPLLKEKKKMI